MQELLNKATEIAQKNGMLSDSSMSLAVDEEKVAKASEALAKAQSKLADKQSALEKAQIAYNAAVEKNGEDSTQAQKAAISLSDAQRKLEDAMGGVTSAENDLAEAQEGTISAFDINSYSDIVQAIHIVQEEMGISGTTAAEAADTIQGSAGSMSAAWENLKVELVKDNGDIGKSIDILVNSALTVFDNIEPKIERALGGVTQFVGKAAPIIVEKLPPIIERIVPPLLTASGSLVVALGKGIAQTLPTLLKSTGSLVSGLYGSFIETDLGAFDWIREDAVKVVDSVKETFGEIDLSNLMDSIAGYGERLNGWWEELGNGFTWAVDNIFTPLIEWGANDILPTVFDGLAASVDILTSALNFLETPAKAVWQEFLQPLAGIAGDVIYGTLDLISKGLQTVADTVDGVDWEGYWIDLFSGDFGEDWELGWADLKTNIEDCGDAIDEFFDTTEFTRSWNEFWQGVGAAIYDEFYNEKWLDFKENFILGWQSIADAVKGFADRVRDAINALKTFLGIQEETPIEETDAYQYYKSHVEGHDYNFDFGDSGEEMGIFPRFGTGRIVTRPTRAVIGEAGAEAVIPLEHQTQWIDKVAERMNSAGNGGGGATYIFNFDGAYIGSKEMARELVQPMSEELQRLYNRGSRGLGGV